MNGGVINHLRYADDIVVLASSQEEQQFIFDSVIEGPSIDFLSMLKTKVVLMSR